MAHLMFRINKLCCSNVEVNEENNKFQKCICYFLIFRLRFYIYCDISDYMLIQPYTYVNICSDFINTALTFFCRIITMKNVYMEYRK